MRRPRPGARSGGQQARPAAADRRADQPARHLGPGDRSAGSHLRLQSRPQAGDGVRHRRQHDDGRRRSGDERQDDQSRTWQHSGTVDWDGNVYVIERDAHRIVKLSPKMDKFLMQLGTTDEKGTDATHFDLPSGIAVLKNGNIIVTDGYGNNRVLLFDKTGKLLKQVGEGRRRPGRQGHRHGEWVLPHKLAVDARGEPLHHRPREQARAGVRQEPQLHPRDRERRLEPVGHRHLAQGRPRASRTSPTTRSSASTRCS